MTRVRGAPFMWETLVIAWRAMHFYGKCINWAATGTLSRANATYGIIGVLIIYLAGKHWGLGTLTIPDDAPSNIFLIIIALFVTWIAIFFTRLIGAPGRLYGDAQDQIPYANGNEVTTQPRLLNSLTRRGPSTKIKTTLSVFPTTHANAWVALWFQP